jgi:hypothetical protein
MGISQDDADYLRWIEIVKEALSCLNKDNFTWLHLPYSGGFYDQDCFIMNIWNVIADEFYLAVNDQEIINFLKVKKNA